MNIHTHRYGDHAVVTMIIVIIIIIIIINLCFC